MLTKWAREGKLRENFALLLLWPTMKRRTYPQTRNATAWPTALTIENNRSKITRWATILTSSFVELWIVVNRNRYFAETLKHFLFKNWNWNAAETVIWLILCYFHLADIMLFWSKYLAETAVFWPKQPKPKLGKTEIPKVSRNCFVRNRTETVFGYPLAVNRVRSALRLPLHYWRPSRISWEHVAAVAVTAATPIPSGPTPF